MRIIFLIGCALSAQLAFSQTSEKKSVVIGTMSSHPNALLVLNPPNNDQGILFPQLTSAQRQAIAPNSPDDDGLIVFDKDDKAFYFWKQGQWTKVLGNDAPHQAIQFDVVSSKLSLDLGGGEVDLSSLKEIPSTSGQSGKYMTTDGVSVKWSTLPPGSTLMGVVPGQGLSGGGNTGNVTLTVNTDNNSLDVNGANVLEIKNGGVTAAKLATGSVTTSAIQASAVDVSKIKATGGSQVLVTDATGANATWISQTALPGSADASPTNELITNLQLAGNSFTITEAGTNHAQDLNGLVLSGDVTGTLKTSKLAAGSVTTSAIQLHAVDVTKIKTSGSNQVLVSDGTGTNALWINQSALPGSADASSSNELITNMQLSGNTVTITEAGTNHTQDLNTLTLGGDVTGTLAASKVTKLQGISVSATSPTDQQILKYDNASGKWIPATIPGVSTSVAFKAVQSFNQQVNGTSQIVWDSEVYDDGGNFALNQFKAPAAGLYHFDVLLTVQGLDQDNTAMGILRVNNSDVQHALYNNSGPKNNDTSVQLSTDIKLNANDVVTVWISVQGGKPGPGPAGAFFMEGGSLSTQFSGRKIY